MKGNNGTLDRESPILYNQSESPILQKERFYQRRKTRNGKQIKTNCLFLIAKGKRKNRAGTKRKIPRYVRERGSKRAGKARVKVFGSRPGFMQKIGRVVHRDAEGTFPVIKPPATLKAIIVLKVFHNVLYIAMKDIAKLVYCIYFDILIMLQPVYLRTVYIVRGIKIVLSNILFTHGNPQPVIFYHFSLA
jgi:hypothetical protein